MLTNAILSQDYADLILQYQLSTEQFLERYSELNPQIFDRQFAFLHPRLSVLDPQLVAQQGYSRVPALYTTLSIESLEYSGILQARRQSSLGLTGKGTLIGFIDTGIDYQHEAFLNTDGTSRIYSIWDQTIQDRPLNDYSYGTEYTSQQINEALASDHPLEIVPSQDENGHGTAMASAACGNVLESYNFSGAAPDARMVVVKLKEAKTYLKDYFLVENNVPCFQETDLMMGIRYVKDIARRENLPIVICLGIGTNQGSHSGSSPLDIYYSNICETSGILGVCAGGNEGNSGHHFRGIAEEINTTDEVDLLIDASVDGFSMEFWGFGGDFYNMNIISPQGETITVFPNALLFRQEYNLILSRTRIYLEGELSEYQSGNQLLMFRFLTPARGIWKFQVTVKQVTDGIYHFWLPITGFISPDIRFLQPEPNVTLTDPSNTYLPVTVTNILVNTGNLALDSSRGYASNRVIKPDIGSPGVLITTATPGGGFTNTSGTSMSAAIAAGAAAMLAEWKLRQNPAQLLSSAELKNYFRLGAKRFDYKSYPNTETGFGVLDVYRIFETIAKF